MICHHQPINSPPVSASLQDQYYSTGPVLDRQPPRRTPIMIEGNVEKSRQRRSRPFAVLTYKLYAPRVKKAAALLDELF